MIIVLLIVVSSFLGIWWYSESSQDEPPVLSSKWPIVGHGHLLIGGLKFFRTIKNLSMECLKNRGILRVYLGPRKYYVVTDPEDCLTIANSCFQKSSLYDFAKPWAGEGLVTGNVVTWKRHRKLLNLVFNQQILSSYIDIFNSQSRRLVDTFADKVGEVFNHRNFLQSSTLNTICMTSIGPKFYSLFNVYLLCFNKMFNILAHRLTHFWLINNFIFNFTSLKQKQDRDINKLDLLFDSVMVTKNMDTRMKHQTVNAKSKNDDKTSEDNNIKTLLSLMLELTDKTKCFTDTEIKEETHTIIAAGYDTTATAMTFAMILLGSYPQVQNKVYEEILEVIGKSDRDVTKDDLSKFVYIEAVLKETMRLYPLTPLIARKIDTEIKLSKVYAMMSMKISLVHLMRKYKVKSDITKLVLKLDLTLKPEAGHHIQLELR